MTPIYARIYKIDEQTRTVTGRAVQEMVDRDGEVFDYKSSKPNFQSWSAEVFADTNGKSYGNVRSMHGNVAAGKLTEIEFNDAEKAIDVSAKIVDDGEWAKCLEGVHTGFSIGGRYARKWSDIQDGKVVQRYTAMPAEISLVDRPCVPSAKFFNVHKRDGSVERRAFASVIPCSNDPHKMALSAIRKIHGHGPSRPEPLLKAVAPPRRSDVLVARAKRLAGELVAGLGKAGIKIAPGLRMMAGKRSTGLSDESVDVIKSIHARGVRKSIILPGQSSNSGWDNNTADTGATNDWRDEKAPANTSSQLGPSHSASVSAGKPPPQDSDSDPTLTALKRIFAAGPKRGL